MGNSDLKFTIFRPEYVEDQARLGKSVTKSWRNYSQSNSDELRKEYNKTSFNPSTRFYMHDSDQLIGFVTCKIENNIGIMAPPIVLDDKFDYIDDIFKFAKDSLISKNCDKIRLTHSKMWGKGFDLINKYKFVKDEILFEEYSGNIDKNLDQIDLNQEMIDDVVQIRKFDKSSDIDQVAEILSEIIGYDFTFAKSILLTENKLEGVVDQLALVLQYRDQVVGWIRGSTVRDQRKLTISTSPGYIINPKYNKYRSLLFGRLLDGMKSNEVDQFNIVITKSTKNQYNSPMVREISKLQEIAYYYLDVTQ